MGACSWLKCGAVAAAVLATLSCPSPGHAQPAKRCKGTKRWYAGQCRYPDEIEQLKQASGTTPAPSPAPAPRPKPEQPKPQPEAPKRNEGDAAACGLARRVDTLDAWKVYREQFPRGDCATEADKRVQALEAEPAPTPEPAASPQASAPEPRSYIERVSPLAWLGFGIGGTGLVMWGVTGAIAASKASSVKEACPDGQCPNAQRGPLGEATALAHVTTASFVVGLVGTAGGITALLLLTDDAAAGPSRDAGATVEPWLGLGQAGLRGRF
jgi:hypothetical protein